MRERGTTRVAALLFTAGLAACAGETRDSRGDVETDASASAGGARAADGGARAADGGARSSGGRDAAGSSGGRDAAGGAPACDGGRCPDPGCHDDQVPVTLPGGCCPTLCGLGGSAGAGGAGPEIDAAPPTTTHACTQGTPIECHSNGFPYCAPDWDTAINWYPACPNAWPPYLARCGGVNTIVVRGPYTSRRFYYGRRGQLVGSELSDASGTHCTAYDAAFEAPDATCVPVGAPCEDAGSLEPPVLPPDAGVDWDGGAPSCEVGQAAYDAYLAAQLAEFNTCSSDVACPWRLGGAPLSPANPCAQPCDLFVSIPGINSQMLGRLDAFGAVACARCELQPECPESPPYVHCVEGRCVGSSER